MRRCQSTPTHASLLMQISHSGHGQSWNCNIVYRFAQPVYSFDDDAPLVLAAAKCSRATYEQAGIGIPTGEDLLYVFEILASEAK